MALTSMRQAERKAPRLTAAPLVIGLAGPSGSGKSCAAYHLCQCYGFVQLSFAEPIKLMLERLFELCGEVDWAYLHEPQLKSAVLPGLLGEVEQCGTQQRLTARLLMQTLGTSWGRQAIHPDFWVRVLAARLGPDGDQYDRIVIDDVRMANEAAWVKRQAGGTLWRVERAPTQQSHPWQQHVTERQDLPAALVDDVLTNDSGMANLWRQLDLHMSRMRIEQREALR